SFFLSSRRRHTRSKRDWSSDVCSSDLDASDIIIYADPNCVYCAQFEAENSEALDELAEDGYSIEYRIVNFLDNPGTDNYSSRAANAMACMAEEHPEHAGDFQIGRAHV